MMRIFFMSTRLKAGAHYRLGVRAAFFPVFSGTLLILNPPCQHVFVRSRTDSVRQSLLADGAGNLALVVPTGGGQEPKHGALGNYSRPGVDLSPAIRTSLLARLSVPIFEPITPS